MTTTTAEPGLKPCECGCGELVKGRYKRGHYLRDQKNKLTTLPGPDDDLDESDDSPDLNGVIRETVDTARLIYGEQGEPDAEIPADRPPGRLKERAAKGAAPPRQALKVTATLRKDVHAKIRFALMPAGQVWQLRDPLCGGAFVEQEPAISDALADIVCDSPDLLAFFTGPAGGFMKYFKLVMALQPVALTVWAHHVVHAIELEQDGQPQMPAYAA